ncbi:MAG: uroporphyrinogen-III synthase [Alphaproteobacteria bacterium]|nr:uroporphyrinogen-III synthase [Alphaproteobacteria bacterium]
MVSLKHKGVVYNDEYRMNILISQNKPNVLKCGYEELSKKYPVNFHFESLIKIETISMFEFKKQRIDLIDYKNIIFSTKNAIEYYFKFMNLLKVKILKDTKYYCLREEIAMYLHKFINFKKRKVFFSQTGTIKSFSEEIANHLDTNHKLLYIISENQQDKQFLKLLKKNNNACDMLYLYRTSYLPIKNLLSHQHFDTFCFTTPSSIQSLWFNDPMFKKQTYLVGTFGENTLNFAKKSFLNVSFSAPNKVSKNLCHAIEEFLKTIIIKVS